MLREPRIALPAHITPEAFAGLDPSRPLRAMEGPTMGTLWRVIWVDNGLSEARLRAAIEARLATIIADMSHWEADSRLCRFNRLEGGAWQVLSPDFAQVINAALPIAAASGGAFDPAQGHLVDLWGFGPPGPVAAPPAPEACAAARTLGGWRRLEWEATARRLRQPGGLALDLSAIAKGFAVDALAQVAGDLGLRHVLVEVGGELVGRGVQPHGEPWWVELENPPGADLPPFRVALHDWAVASSGRWIKGAHDIDPRTGAPSESGVVACNVLHSSAMWADGWATALSVLGPQEGGALAARLGLAARLVSATPDGWREHITPALAERLAD